MAASVPPSAPATRNRSWIWLSLAPVLVLGLVFGSSVLYGLAQSLGYLSIIGETTISFQAYANLLDNQRPVGAEFWAALGFSLWISGAATLLSAIAALIIARGLQQLHADRGVSLLLLQFNLSLPHIVWAVALLLLIGQSGILARIATSLGGITTPAEFPVLVRDSYGIGIILHYLGKEIPFLSLLLFAVLQTQGNHYQQLATTLGANRLQRMWYVTLPLVWPSIAAGSLTVFGYIFSAYEVPALLGVRYPRALAVVALDYFLNPDLNRRAEAMAISIIMSSFVIGLAGIVQLLRTARGSHP